MRRSVGSTPRFSSILCPVDFSEPSRAALRHAAALAARGGGALDVLFVNDPLLVAAAAAAYNRATLGAATTIELERFVTRTLPPGVAARISPHFATALGKPAREIRKRVASNGHDTVVIGTKGLNGARRLLLGSTTIDVLRHASVPVLAVPPGESRRQPSPAWPGKTIVAAIELGPHAARDVRQAAAVARWFKTSLVLVHVVSMPALPSWVSANLEAHLRKDCENAARALDALRAETAGVRTTIRVSLGHPPDEIAKAAADCRAGLIVMALRGRSGLFGEAAGACTYQVLCHDVAPVLALPDSR